MRGQRLLTTCHFFQIFDSFLQAKITILCVSSRKKERKWRVKSEYIAINTIKKFWSNSQAKTVDFNFCKFSKPLNAGALWESLQESWLPLPNHCKYWHFIWQKVFNTKLRLWQWFLMLICVFRISSFSTC